MGIAFLLILPLLLILIPTIELAITKNEESREQLQTQLKVIAIFAGLFYLVGFGVCTYIFFG